MSKPKTNARFAGMLSAFVYPGAGHFLLKRPWRGAFFAVMFTVGFVALIVVALAPQVHNLKVALDDASGIGAGAGEQFHTISIKGLALSFVMALVFYLAALFDARHLARKQLSSPHPPDLPVDHKES